MKSVLRFAAVGACLSVLSLTTAQASMSDNLKFYGVIDLGIHYLNNGPSEENQTGMTDGVLNGSRWGVRGNEKISDDLSALVVLEGGFNSTTGRIGQGGRLFGRQATVGLHSKTNGRLMLGRQNTHMITWMNKHNPFANGNFTSGKRMDAAFSDRMDHGIRYDKSFGSVSVGAYYSLGWNNDTVDWSDEKVGKMLGLGARYKEGPLDVAALYHSKHGNTATSSGNKEDRFLLAMTYRLERMDLFTGYRLLDQELDTANSDVSSHLVWGGVTLMLNDAKSQRINLAAFAMDGVACGLTANTCNANTQKDQSPVMFAAGYEHDLSKRTTLYTNVAHVSNDKGTAISIIGGNNVQDDKNQSGIIVGIRHNF